MSAFPCACVAILLGVASSRKILRKTVKSVRVNILKKQTPYIWTKSETFTALPRRHDIHCLDAHRNIKIHWMTISKVGWKISSGWSLYSPKMRSSHRTSGREHDNGWDSDKNYQVGSATPIRGGLYVGPTENGMYKIEEDHSRMGGCPTSIGGQQKFH